MKAICDLKLYAVRWSVSLLAPRLRALGRQRSWAARPQAHIAVTTEFSIRTPRDYRLSRLRARQTHWASMETDVVEKYFTRVDVTEEFPFLVTKLSPYYALAP